MPSSLSAQGPSLSIPAIDAFQLQLTPFNSTQAELEYPEGHVSTSVYVAFPINADDEAANYPAEHREKLKNASLAVWTTTPWTMPANAAVAVNDKLSYSLCEVTGVAATKEDAPSSDAAAMVGKTLIVATDLVSDVASRWGLTLAAVADVAGAQLEGLTYAHPFYPADGGETASHTTPFAWCASFLKDFSGRHSSPALPF